MEAADLDREGGEAMTTTTFREEMTTLTTSDSVRPIHITIHHSDKEKGGLTVKEKRGERLLWTRIFKGDLEEEKGDNTRTNNNEDRQHTTIKHDTVEVGGRRRW